MSNDKDWYQYMREGEVDIFVKNTVHTYKSVQLRLGYPPEHVVIYKILKGDSSDNIPGITGFPEVLALAMAKSVQNYKDLLTFNFPYSMRKWRVILKQRWSIVERNAMLIQFNPEWIEKALFTVTKRTGDKKKLVQLLRERGVNSIANKLEGVV